MKAWQREQPAVKDRQVTGSNPVIVNSDVAQWAEQQAPDQFTPDPSMAPAGQKRATNGNCQVTLYRWFTDS